MLSSGWWCRFCSVFAVLVYLGAVTNSYRVISSDAKFAKPYEKSHLIFLESEKPGLNNIIYKYHMLDCNLNKDGILKFICDCMKIIS